MPSLLVGKLWPGGRGLSNTPPRPVLNGKSYFTVRARERGQPKHLETHEFV